MIAEVQALCMKMHTCFPPCLQRCTRSDLQIGLVQAKGIKQVFMSDRQHTVILCVVAVRRCEPHPCRFRRKSPTEDVTEIAGAFTWYELDSEVRTTSKRQQ